MKSDHMKRSRKSNRVTWAPGVNLCQVKLFLTEDCPSKVGSQAQGNLRKKKSWMMHPANANANANANDFNDLPPGFEGCFSSRVEPSLVPTVQWKCPPKLVMSCGLHVAAGEESQELKVHKVREMRVLEAVYPRPSAIPPSPFIPLDVEEENYDDSLTPIIPLEEEAEITDSSAQSSTLQKSPDLLPNFELELDTNMKANHGQSPDTGADLVAAASAATTALVKSMEVGSQIDTNLLIKILSDPNMIDKLINNKQSPVNVTTSPMVPNHCDGNLHNKFPVSKPATVPTSAPTVFSSPVAGFSQPATTVKPAASAIQMPIQPVGWPIVPNLVHSEVKNVVTQPMAAAAAAAPAKDINYIKNLIREHGTEKKEPMHDQNYNTNKIQNLEFVQNMNRREGRPKFQKICTYYSSPKGCRNGSSCPYLHDFPFQFQTMEAPCSKRIKLSGEIVGRT